MKNFPRIFQGGWSFDPYLAETALLFSANQNYSEETLTIWPRWTGVQADRWSFRCSKVSTFPRSCTRWPPRWSEGRFNWVVPDAIWADKWKGSSKKLSPSPHDQGSNSAFLLSFSSGILLKTRLLSSPGMLLSSEVGCCWVSPLTCSWWRRGRESAIWYFLQINFSQLSYSSTKFIFREVLYNVSLW